MPPHPPPPPPHHRHVPPSAITAFIDETRIDRLLERWIPDKHDRRFVRRCVLEEGPAHHRGANYILLSLLEMLLVAAEGGAEPPRAERPPGGVPIPLRLPPHLAKHVDHAEFPLRMPTRALERLADGSSPEFAAMVDCLTDGPPQHALANAIMVAILDRLIAGAPPPGDARSK